MGGCEWDVSETADTSNQVQSRPCRRPRTCQKEGIELGRIPLAAVWIQPGEVDGGLAGGSTPCSLSMHSCVSSSPAHHQHFRRGGVRKSNAKGISHMNPLPAPMRRGANMQRHPSSLSPHTTPPPPHPPPRIQSAAREQNIFPSAVRHVWPRCFADCASFTCLGVPGG